MPPADPEPPGHAVMTKRLGITLIELLLAIGLALVLSGIVLPAVFTGLRERAFESTVEVVRNQFLLARAHAQITRRPVEVMYDDRPPRSARVWAQYFLVDQEQEQDILPDQLIVEGWADRALADGLGITDRSATEQDEPRSFRLAVYMPDGSALMSRPVWISDDHGRRGKIQVNPWTGLPSFERIFGGETEPPDETPDDSPDDTRDETLDEPPFGFLQPPEDEP